MSRPAVIFDRDGVVNVSPGAGYVLRWQDFSFAEGIIAALRLCRDRGYATILATSQQGVGKGLMSQADLDDIHTQMQAELQKQGAQFDGIYACTCLKTDPDCSCRKPSADMVLRAARDHDLDLSHSILVGDADRDIEMGMNAGVPVTIRIESENPHLVAATHTLPDTTGLQALLESCLVDPGMEDR
ncbi:MAG: HAD-IIIA family hydrolase [Verrucomicrobia bacterium]|nr:HAD-IIIA family hydrolase [Verrucomicrobiota bacterium]